MSVKVMKGGLRPTCFGLNLQILIGLSLWTKFKIRKSNIVRKKYLMTSHVKGVDISNQNLGRLIDNF